MSNVVLLKASSLAEALPGRWWTPSPDLLDAIEPGKANVKLLALVPDADGSANPWAASAIWMAIDARDGDQLSGSVLQTQIDCEGYRVGDRLTAARDRVLALVFIGLDGRPMLNEPRAHFMLGKRVLIGLTVLSDADDLLEQSQIVGTVAGVDSNRGIELKLDDYSTYWLPPDARAFEEAPPGEYGLRSNGQTVVDPGYVSTWTVRQGHDSYTPPPEGYRPANR